MPTSVLPGGGGPIKPPRPHPTPAHGPAAALATTRLGRLLDPDVEARPLYAYACPDDIGPFHARLLQPAVDGRDLYACVPCTRGSDSSSAAVAGSDSSSSDDGEHRMARLLAQDVDGRPLYAAEDPCCPELSESSSSASGSSSSSSSSSSGSSSSSSLSSSSSSGSASSSSASDSSASASSASASSSSGSASSSSASDSSASASSSGGSSGSSGSLSGGSSSRSRTGILTPCCDGLIPTPLYATISGTSSACACLDDLNLGSWELVNSGGPGIQTWTTLFHTNPKACPDGNEFAFDLHITFFCGDPIGGASNAWWVTMPSAVPGGFGWESLQQYYGPFTIDCNNVLLSVPLNLRLQNAAGGCAPMVLLGNFTLTISE